MMWLEKIGVVPEHEHLSRLDVQVSVGMPILPFWSATEKGHFRCRQRMNTRVASDDPESISFGSHKSPIMFRCYDKVRETQTNSEAKFNSLVAHFHGYEVPTRPVTRFEFESHRNVLRTIGIHTFADVLQRGTAFIEYLCGWIRFTQDHDYNHSDRNRTLPEWELVKAMFHATFDAGEERLENRTRTKGSSMTVEQQKRTDSTISTLFSRLAMEQYRQVGGDPYEAFRAIFSKISADAQEKFRTLLLKEIANNPDNLYQVLKSE